MTAYNQVLPAMIAEIRKQDPVIAVTTKDGDVWHYRLKEIDPFLGRQMPVEFFEGRVGRVHEIADRVVGFNTQSVADLAPQVRRHLFPLMVTLKRPERLSFLEQIMQGD